MSKVVGIDLGTSNSCVAYIEDGNPKVIKDSSGRNTTPSIYTLDSSFKPICGYEAKEQAELNRENTIFAVKRLIGRKFSSAEVRDAMEKLPYKIIPANNLDAWVEVRGLSKSPEEVSSEILVKMKEIAEQALNEKVLRAVITVPAHFNDAQRQATKDAGKLAGLDIMRIINEPTAAALAYGLDVVNQEKVEEGKNSWQKKNSADRIIGVFDLGGGTFDISLLSMKDGVFDVLSTNGDTFLGGEDFDLAIVNYLLFEFMARTGVNLKQNKSALEKLKQAAREAKHDLTYKNKTLVSLSFIQGMEHIELVIDRKKLEEIVEPILSRLENPCLMALEDAGLDPKDVTDVVLVGGMTRMPAVKKRCQSIFGVKPLDSIDPDEAVALGAAVQAGLLEGLVKGVSLLDVTSLSLGIEVQGGMTHVIIPRNTTIPAEQTEIFTTSAPNQPQVDIHVVQGESDFSPNNKSLGRFSLKGIPPAARGEPEIAVSFKVDAEGLVHVAAKDLHTGGEESIEIVASSGLDDEAIQSLINEQKMIQEQLENTLRRESGVNKPQINKNIEVNSELEEFRASLKNLIFMTQFKLNSEGKNYKGNERSILEKSLSVARNAMDAEADIEGLKVVLNDLYAQAKLLDQFLEGKI